MSELIMEMPKCPICGQPTVRGVGDSCHCGRARLLTSVEEHYLSFKFEPEEWPRTGCPVCGRPMKEAGKWKPLSLMPASKGEGLERMLCDQQDHYCYVTKAWYDKNRRGTSAFFSGCNLAKQAVVMLCEEGDLRDLRRHGYAAEEKVI